MTVLILSIIPLFIIDRNSAEFVVDVIAILVSVIFLTIVSWDVRRQVRRSATPDEDIPAN